MHVGLLGAGRIGALHARLLAQNPLVDSLTITDTEAGRAAAVARQLDARCQGTPEEVVRSGVHALVIAAATPAHAALIHLAASSGLPAFCEKPISLDLETTDDVLRHVRETGTFLQVGFQRRFDPGYRAARDAVQSGRLGELLIVRAATHDREPPPEDYLAASGGMWRDLLIHDFDVLPWVTGRRITEVYADGTAGSEPFGRLGDVDRAVAVVRLDDGALGLVSGSRWDPLGYDVRLELLGSRDSIAVGVSERVALRSVEPGAAQSTDGYRDFMERFESAYRYELEAFVERVRYGGESPCSGADARRALCVALAAEQSFRERRPVQVEEVG